MKRKQNKVKVRKKYKKIRSWKLKAARQVISDKLYHSIYKCNKYLFYINETNIH